jgi:hypothetical protein
MRSFGFIPFITIFILHFATPPCLAQQSVIPRPSPLAIVSARYKNHYIKITYSQPHKNGRQIFGKLVPYGKIWRTGANEATELTTLKDIIVNGTVLKAGTYSLFTIPEEDHWTIIFNSEVGLWGSYNHNEALDVLRFDTPVQKIPGDLVYEAFTIQLDHENDLVNLLMMWDKTKISIPIKLNN